MILEMKEMDIWYGIIISNVFAHEDKITIVLTETENTVKIICPHGRHLAGKWDLFIEWHQTLFDEFAEKHDKKPIKARISHLIRQDIVILITSYNLS